MDQSPPAPPEPPEKHWLLWQLADSAFPSGGFTHSAGLEAAWQQGEVSGSIGLASFIEASLLQLGRGALPFFTAAHREPDKLARVDHLCDAFTTSHVANRASRQQGRAFLASVERIFGTPLPQPPCGHSAPVLGAVTRLLGVDLSDAGRLFFFVHLRGLAASSVRLGIVGPMEAQRLQYRLSGRAREILDGFESLPLDNLAQTSPLLEIWQGSQDRLYSRLFQS